MPSLMHYLCIGLVMERISKTKMTPWCFTHVATNNTVIIIISILLILIEMSLISTNCWAEVIEKSRSSSREELDIFAENLH